MTAGELIDWLSKLPSDLPVIMPDEDGDFCQVTSVFEDLAFIGDGQVQLADERDGAMARKVVRFFGPDENSLGPSRGSPSRWASQQRRRTGYLM
jgi:hypothetical protein